MIGGTIIDEDPLEFKTRLLSVVLKGLQKRWKGFLLVENRDNQSDFHDFGSFGFAAGASAFFATGSEPRL